jgi:hypothetical protein
VTIENTRGDILIRSWEQDRVQLIAEKKGGPKEDMDLVPVKITARDDELIITSLIPEYVPDLNVRVDYRLRVPEQVDLKLIKTTSGEIRVSDVSGRAILWTDNGNIKVEGFSGILDARSHTYGELDVELTDLSRNDHVNLENINGDVFLRLPKNADAFWIVRTLNGSIEAEIPFTIKNNFGPQVVHHPNDDGKALIRIYSVRSDIHIDER